ncbi:hypothetical protein lacNasYZ03_06550 [Lactobacillus nasalidis]|uniref:Bacteriocin immunity protein n=1 Tax=Lactobacillus nasalidis TaxID=2797258 RepID=A0ABQ3W3I2_9LACO|nr:bacteriocin immunity protein [Lactobacillus nasalidis]GHV97308.1 hypothetical protein lacNasYZ01_04900 [Lactobacillus nasalidis]GHV98854.1 hypothetical protein lacNasYZ02_02840 [Lactobacillus nasalidis]GHW00968.1 hypothetical protein lacNasYZ03_06550 [Lactobacillus nasalidis]
MFGKKKKEAAEKAKEAASKKTDGRILLYSDIIDALYDEMPKDEREALLEAKQQLEHKVYLGKIMYDLRIALEPVVIKSQLSPQGKKIFWNITAGGYQLTGVGLAGQAAMLFGGR